VLVVKAARPRERGVIVADYSYVFPLLVGLFDVDRIAERYFIVLEPSWRGACAPEILSYGRLNAPVFVETIEPHDRRLFAALNSNLHVVPTPANYWVDSRGVVNRPAKRDIDVIMVASWSRIKRHWRVFKALKSLRRRGHRLKIALVGYPQDLTAADILDQARYFGVSDQLELFERISRDQVNALLWRSKVHVLWSRTECANRAIIEAMLADVPVLVREGLSYGYRYPYINPQTGHFVPEHELEDRLLQVVATKDEYRPREWVLQHMSCGQSTNVLEAAIREQALKIGESWSEGLVVRTSGLDAQRYWNVSDAPRFEKDYEFLDSVMTKS
jgi:glycosyltransferase involved in cell wall biosynthesis